MDKEHTCCVTGHRDIPAEKVAYVKDQLYQELLRAVQSGYTHFISGFASGADLIFAGLVAGLKREYPITLEAAIPYPGRMYSPDQTFQHLLKVCDVVKIHTGQYSKKLLHGAQPLYGRFFRTRDRGARRPPYRRNGGNAPIRLSGKTRRAGSQALNVIFRTL